MEAVGQGNKQAGSHLDSISVTDKRCPWRGELDRIIGSLKKKKKVAALCISEKQQRKNVVIQVLMSAEMQTDKETESQTLHHHSYPPAALPPATFMFPGPSCELQHVK